MVVYITQYSAYRSHMNFREPDAFRPEFWLDGPAFNDNNRDVVESFITGPYSYIRKRLAYMEASHVLARVLWNFDWQPGEKNLTLEDEKVYALCRNHPSICSSNHLVVWLHLLTMCWIETW